MMINGRYFEKAENFIGRAFYLLKTIPIEGEERTLSLFSHSGKHERGKVNLQLSIKGLREDTPIDVSIREHTILLKLIVNMESLEVNSLSLSLSSLSHLSRLFLSHLLPLSLCLSLSSVSLLSLSVCSWFSCVCTHRRTAVHTLGCGMPNLAMRLRRYY